MTNDLETDRLISTEGGQGEETEPQLVCNKKGMAAGYKAMPVSFLASFAMAATAASTVYAYAHILCEDGSQCGDSEKAIYASAVAAASTIANVCGLMAVSVYERLPTQMGLVVWVGLRAGSVVMLGVGVLRKSIALALSARILEGLATDNTLHMVLNALYARPNHQDDVGRLMAASLALYMAGMALSPALAALLSDFRVSFAMALALFAVTAVYLAAVGPLNDDDGSVRTGNEAANIHNDLGVLLFPTRHLVSNRVVAAHGGTMLLYNVAVSYMFPALMVHATLRFGFTPAQNALILSVAAGASALYLLMAAVTLQSACNTAPVLVSLAVLVGALCALALVPVAWALFPVVAIAALGLATPSFVKAHLVQRRQHDSLAVAALSIAEGVGSLLSAPVLGGWQSTHPNGSVLYLAAMLAATSAGVFLVGCA